MSAASLRRKEVESTPSRVAASTLVKFAPEPEKDVAVTIPLALPIFILLPTFKSLPTKFIPNLAVTIPIESTLVTSS